MRCLADFEVVAELCLKQPNEVIAFSLPFGNVEVHLKNDANRATAQASLLSVRIIFAADDLDSAVELSQSILADVLSALAFVTNGAFSLHRLKKIVDWTPGIVDRQMLVFAGAAAASPAEALLDRDLLKIVEDMNQLNLDTPIRSAMRWFRLGVGAEVLEEQFQYFWFALEIIAGIDKPNEKVHDRCTKCNGALYCEACKVHPTHRLFASQAIAKIIGDITGDTKGEVYAAISLVRNTLMHGRMLDEIEKDLPCESYKVVDRLGMIVWKALASLLTSKYKFQIPNVLLPSTYIRHALSAYTNITVRLPDGPNGLNVGSIDDIGINVEIVRS